MDFSIVTIVTVIIAGIITAFLPCTYPMIVGYVSLLLTGVRRSRLLPALRVTFYFFLGFAITYVIFGSVAGLFGQFSQTTIFFNNLKPIFITVGGVLFLIIGFMSLNVVPLPARLKRLRSIPLPKLKSFGSWWGAILMGIIFSAGWSPCIGPVLGGILLLAGSSGSVINGSLLLLFFSVGLMIPLLCISIIYVKASKYISLGEKFTPYARAISGIIFITLGILFLTGKIGVFESFIPFEGFEKYI